VGKHHHKTGNNPQPVKPYFPFPFHNYKYTLFSFAALTDIMFETTFFCRGGKENVPKRQKRCRLDSQNA
jgi:hypothetical protein